MANRRRFVVGLSRLLDNGVVMDPFEIPDFLRIPAEERAASWKGRKLTSSRKDKTKKTGNLDLPKTIDAAGLALARQIEKEKAAKTKARLAALKSRRSK